MSNVRYTSSAERAYFLTHKRAALDYPEDYIQGTGMIGTLYIAIIDTLLNSLDIGEWLHQRFIEHTKNERELYLGRNRR